MLQYLTYSIVEYRTQRRTKALTSTYEQTELGTMIINNMIAILAWPANFASRNFAVWKFSQSNYESKNFKLLKTVNVKIAKAYIYIEN